jgi:archaemetzincin
MPIVNKIAIIPTFYTPELLLEMIKIQIGILFNKETVVLQEIEAPLFALDKIRLQYNAAKILNKYENTFGQKHIKTVVILDVDIFIPIFTHLFGEARLGGSTALISTKRLYNNDPLEQLCERAVKVTLHELGHLYNLTHCMDSNCLMFFAGDIQHLDTIPPRFCNYCSQYIKDTI